jgi:hypothetical protein
MSDTTSFGGLPQIVRDPTDGQVKGLVQIAQGEQPKPCYLCRSFEKDNKKLVQHLLAHGLKPDEEGRFETPLAKEVQGRRSLKIDPKDYGYCRKSCMPTGMTATCEYWVLTQFREEMARKIR